MKHIISLLLTFSFFICSVMAQDKIDILKAEDLPKHSYELKNKDAVAIVTSKENILELATLVKEDLLTDLEKYNIKENATLRSYYYGLRAISVIEGDYQKALEYIRKERDLADKESQKIMRGIWIEALIHAAVNNKTLDANILNPQITKFIEEQLNAVEFNIIQEDVEEAKGSSEIMSENLIMGIVKSQIQSALDNNKGEIPGDLIIDLIDFYYTLNYNIPYKDGIQSAFTNILKENVQDVEKINIWEERNVALKEDTKYSPVLIGIWDTGVDMPVLPEKNRWINKNEKFDGKDTDGNGYVDDVYGIAYNLEGLKDPNYLEPLANNLKYKKVYQQYLKGLMDLQANISSEEASNLKVYLSKLKPEDVNGFLENLSLFSNYVHGTHVAGIAEAGNDMARIILARLTSDYKNIPTPPTEENIANLAKSYGEVIKYFKEHNVKVVNMSWGVSYEYYIRILELNGIGKNDVERKAIAKEYYDRVYNSFKKALESASEILFVCAAGNSNDDVDFSADYPSSLNLPNLITVGAVDIEGKKTSFTTEGKSVDVYANGYEIESYVPGGDRIALSGTSMASPNVANLAGKILAVNPKLNPKQVIDIIIKTSTVSKEDEKVLLIHPKNAIELASTKN